MTASLTLVVLMAVLFGAGISIMLERSLTRVLIGFLLVGNAVNILIYLMSGAPGLAPILGEGVDPDEISDPLPQAFVLTAIVINLGITAFMLALIYRSWWLAQLGAKGDLIDDEEEDVAGRRGGGRPHPQLRGRRRGRSRRSSTRATRSPTRTSSSRHRARVTPASATATTRRCADDRRARAPRRAAAAARRGIRADPRPAPPRADGRERHRARDRRRDRGACCSSRSTPASRRSCTSAAGRPPFGIVLVVDRLSAIMLLISAIVLLVVLVYAVGQGVADRHRETPVSIFHPSYLILSAGVFNAFIAGDLFNLYVGFEILLSASYVLLTLGGTGERIRAGVTYIIVSLVSSLFFLSAIALIYGATGTVNIAQLSVRIAELPDERAAHPAPAAAHRVRHQGGGLPALVLAARLVPDGARTGHRGVRRPAHEGRRLRHHPHRDA